MAPTVFTVPWECVGNRVIPYESVNRIHDSHHLDSVKKCYGTVKNFTDFTSQLLRRFPLADAKEPGGEVNDIPGSSTAKAEEIVLIQLQAGVGIMVEWAEGHTALADRQPIPPGSLSYGNRRPDLLIDRHVHTSILY